jgi:hypothetical protein
LRDLLGLLGLLIGELIVHQARRQGQLRLRLLLADAFRPLDTVSHGPAHSFSSRSCKFSQFAKAIVCRSAGCDLLTWSLRRLLGRLGRSRLLSRR